MDPEERELVSSKDIKRIRRRALKENLFGACYLCRLAKVRCSRDRPCARCIQLKHDDLCVQQVPSEQPSHPSLIQLPIQPLARRSRPDVYPPAAYTRALRPPYYSPSRAPPSSALT